jgi:serine acetyltransferase
MIHETAIVEQGAAIGPGTKVWHHAQVRSGAVIGRDCIIGKGVYIGEKVRIGNRCKIQNYACIYGPCELEDEVFVGPHAIVTNDRWPRATLPNGKLVIEWELDKVLIRKRASIGAGAILLPGVEVGEHAMIGAGAIVLEWVPNGAIMVGAPAYCVGYVKDDR